MHCEHVDDQLERITAMAMSSNRQCMALACKFRNDKSAYVFFYDILQLHPLKRTGKFIHEGAPTDEEDKQFISIAFSPEAKYLAVLTNIKDGNARLYEWKKEARVIATNSWLSELNKEAKVPVNAEITRISIDPNNKDQVCLSGKGHFRVWRNQSNILKPLPPIAGLDQAKGYTEHVWLEGNWLVGGTDHGELCVVYDGKQCVLVTPAFGGAPDAVSCIHPFSQGIFVGSSAGHITVWERHDVASKDLSEETLKGAIKFDRSIRTNSL
ncbi:MAG: WD40 repeat domain-containing protein [Candidatus Pacebacteria bacterium]|nr:WD40 repeat domain-containing protein [Candidatus Paceibacterota bacterium]